MLNVVFEDNHLLVVEKPPNLLVQGDVTGDDCLFEQIKRYIAEKYHKPGAVYLGLVHRMDRPVGGLIVFARTGKAAARLSAQLREHSMQREYLTVVHGRPQRSNEVLHDFLVKDTKSNKVKAVPGNVQGAQEAMLHFSVLDYCSQEDLTLLHIRLKTGRKHQIRVQLAHHGYPIVQDMRYGIDEAGESIALWGAVLKFEHPTAKKNLIFISHPKGTIFRHFPKALDTFFSTVEQGEES